MRIKATDDQVKKMCALASQASLPMGMGFLHFNASTEFKPEEFGFAFVGSGVHLDYVQGRMVKLRLRRVKGEESIWEAADEIRADYQSWSAKYPSYAFLAEAAGAAAIV